MDQGTSKEYTIEDLCGNPTALDELSASLDPQFKTLPNLEHLAFVLGIPSEVIRSFTLYLVSPTIRLFEYLEVTKRELTIDELREALKGNAFKARHDVIKMIQEFGGEDKVSRYITNSSTDPDILDQIALRLDFATSRSTYIWKDLALRLHVPRNKLQQFEMYSYNPTERLFHYLYTTKEKPVPLSTVMDCLQEMNREDILVEVRKITNSKDVNTLKAKDIFQLGSELLETTSYLLNKEVAGVEGWEGLARRLIDDLEIISKLKPPSLHDAHSPTKKMMAWLSEQRPGTKIKSLIDKCVQIKRNDVVDILVKYFTQASGHEPRTHDEQDGPSLPLLSCSVQETSETSEHILKDHTRSFGLPKSSTKMIGRMQEKENLVSDLTCGKHKLVVLHATTGCGKETLAIATARELIEKHDYTCIYVTSEGIYSVEDLSIKILATCRIPTPSAGDNEEKVKELFRNVARKCILILDNFDHMFHADDKAIGHGINRKDGNKDKNTLPEISSSDANASVSSYSTSDSGMTNSTSSWTPKDFPWHKSTRMSKKEKYLQFLGELSKSASNLAIFATTWESFSADMDTKEVELNPLGPDESEELLLSRCKSVLGIERADISSDRLSVVLKCCSGIPQLLRNAVTAFNKIGFEEGASRIASSSLERQHKLLCSDKMSEKERWDCCLRICFNRLDKIAQKILLMISVFPGSFLLEEAAKIFNEIIPDRNELEDGLMKLIDFSFLFYNQEQKAYYLSPAMRSFAICKATSSSTNSDQEPMSKTDSFETELSHTYKSAISRFVYYTFNVTLKIENDFFSTRIRDAIYKYRKQEENLREIAHWCITDRFSTDPDLKRLKCYIIQSFIQCYLVNLKLMQVHLLKTIICRFSRFCQGVKDREKEFIECLTYGGVTCILSCLCVPQLCPLAQQQAMYCFNEALKVMSSGYSVSQIPSLITQLQIVSKCKTMSKGAQTQFLIKYGKCLVRQGRKEDGLKFIQKGIEIRKQVVKKSKSAKIIKDHVMVAEGYNDLAGAYSYTSDYGTAIHLRETNVLPVYHKYLGIHPFTATALSHLAHDYLALDCQEEALKACKTALSYRETLLGEHSETARSLFDMGRILREQASRCENPDERKGKYEEALRYLRKALQMREHLAYTSKETAQNHIEIADVLKYLERHAEAEKHEEISYNYSRRVDRSHSNEVT